MQRLHWIGMAAVLAMLVLLLAGCTAPVAPAAPAGEAASSEAAAPAAGEKAKILFWDQFPDVSDQMDKIVADFNAAHPEHRGRRVRAIKPKPCSDVIKPALSSGTGPDIFYYNLGPGFAGVLAKAGLAMPLDDAYAEKGWDKRIYPWTRERSTFDGKSYGVANELEFIGVYYNKRMFEENGWADAQDVGRPGYAVRQRQGSRRDSDRLYQWRQLAVLSYVQHGDEQ